MPAARYLKYALGEIILVVIGILIALSINNWNQDRIESKKEKLVLNDLIVDLKEQSNVLETYIEIESNYYKNGKDILNYYASNQTFAGDDSIYAKLTLLTARKTFNPIRTTFEEVISTGTIGILHNKSTRRKIIQYYNELERISMVIGNNNIYIIDAIYQPKILEQVFYIKDASDVEFNEINSTIFDYKSLNELRNTSEHVISVNENTLHIFNILEQRTLIAKSHLDTYLALKIETESLLSEIKLQIKEP